MFKVNWIYYYKIIKKLLFYVMFRYFCDVRFVKKLSFIYT